MATSALVFWLVGLLLLLRATAAESVDAANRWEASSISEPSNTLGGVKPLASWIWNSGEENPQNYYLLVRKTFTLDKLPSQARAYISAYAYADVYINGKLLERCPINCDPEYQCYDHFDILPYLQPGENCISAIVQNFGVGLHSQMNGRGGFFFQGKLDHADGSTTNLLSDGSWKVTHAKAWNPQSPFREPGAHLIGFIEDFDARLWPAGWQEPGFDDQSWENAKVIGVPPVTPWNQLVVTERPRLVRKVVEPVHQWQAGDRMVYDFGDEIAGYPQFTLNAAEEGVQFELGTGERLDENKRPLVRASGDHSEKYTTRKGVQSWRPYTWTGFRYLSIETKPGVDLQSVSAEFACYDYEMGGSFECSDPLLNRIWEVGRHTMRINSIDTYEDPWREHTQYIAADSRYMMIYGNYAFGRSSRFLSAYNLLCGAQSQRWRADGAVRGRYPTDYLLQPGSSAYLADYQLEWALMLREYFVCYGHDERIAHLYPNLQQAMEYFRPFVDPQTGLLSNLPGWIVLDWPDTYSIEKKSAITAVNCEYYGALTAAAAIAADFAHDPQQAEVWNEQARQLKEKINTELWSENDRAYLDTLGGTQAGQQTQVYALTYGLADDRRRADLTKLITSRGKASQQSFAYRVVAAMFAEDQDQWALDYIRQHWGAQMHLPSFNGAWHEGWDLPWGSTSHAWSSGPTALLPEKVLGVEPTGYGWKTFQVKPHLGDLPWAKGTVSTVAGNITAAWQKSAGEAFQLQLRVPPETTATVYLPATDSNKIKMDGRWLAEDPEVKPHQEAGKWVVVTVGGGEHRFECQRTDH